MVFLKKKFYNLREKVTYPPTTITNTSTVLNRYFVLFNLATDSYFAPSDEFCLALHDATCDTLVVLIRRACLYFLIILKITRLYGSLVLPQIRIWGVLLPNFIIAPSHDKYYSLRSSEILTFLSDCTL